MFTDKECADKTLGKCIPIGGGQEPCEFLGKFKGGTLCTRKWSLVYSDGFLPSDCQKAIPTKGLVKDDCRKSCDNCGK